MNIVLIGAVYPYKTALSHYVGMLYRQLKKKNHVKLYSYSMWYPKFMYRKEQRDYADDTLKIEEAEYVLNTANPFSWVKMAGRINRENVDLLILQWQHPYFTPCYYVISKLLKNTKLLYICHNSLPHERFRGDMILTKIALKQGDYLIFHAKSDESIIKEMLPGIKSAISPHPTYNFFKVTGISRKEARNDLKIGQGEKILLFFGLVREYKGLKYLLQAMPEIIRTFDDLRLFIVGDFETRENMHTYTSMIEELRIERYVEIRDGFVPIPEAEKYFAACDMVTLPYISATQSGVIQVAYGFDKPVLATNVGGLPDAVDHMKTGYVVEPENAGAIAGAVVDFFHNERSGEFKEHVREQEYRFSWERMEETIDRLVEPEMSESSLGFKDYAEKVI